MIVASPSSGPSRVSASATVAVDSRCDCVAAPPLRALCVAVSRRDSEWNENAVRWREWMRCMLASSVRRRPSGWQKREVNGSDASRPSIVPFVCVCGCRADIRTKRGSWRKEKGEHFRLDPSAWCVLTAARRSNHQQSLAESKRSSTSV